MNLKTVLFLKNNMKAVFFDLFFTLADLEYQRINEFTLLNISRSHWENSAENPTAYSFRATGKVKTEKEMLESMVAGLPFAVTDSQLKKLVEIRCDRMKKALTEIHPDILLTLEKLKAAGIKLCLVSNADIIDKKYWDISPLKQYFDCAIFSCDVGIVKPDKAIYSLAMEKLGSAASESIFVGDGGSNELAGAKAVGMTTVLTEFLSVKDNATREKILQWADFTVTDFKEIYDIVTKI